MKEKNERNHPYRSTASTKQLHNILRVWFSARMLFHQSQHSTPKILTNKRLCLHDVKICGNNCQYRTLANQSNSSSLEIGIYMKIKANYNRFPGCIIVCKHVCKMCSFQGCLDVVKVLRGHSFYSNIFYRLLEACVTPKFWGKIQMNHRSFLWAFPLAPNTKVKVFFNQLWTLGGSLEL